MSASMMAVLWPRRLSCTASSEVTRLLPTPPLPLTTPITFLTLLSSWGFSRKSSGDICLLGQSSPQELQSWVHSLIVSISFKIVDLFSIGRRARFVNRVRLETPPSLKIQQPRSKL